MGVEVFPHKVSHAFRVVDHLAVPIYDPGWGADEELLLLEAIDTHGPHSWDKIAEHVGTRTPAECHHHYLAVYWEHDQAPLPRALPSLAGVDPGRGVALAQGAADGVGEAVGAGRRGVRSAAEDEAAVEEAAPARGGRGGKRTAEDAGKFSVQASWPYMAQMLVAAQWVGVIPLPASLAGPVSPGKGKKAKHHHQAADGKPAANHDEQGVTRTLRRGRSAGASTSTVMHPGDAACVSSRTKVRRPSQVLGGPRPCVGAQHGGGDGLLLEAPGIRPRLGQRGRSTRGGARVHRGRHGGQPRAQAAGGAGVQPTPGRARAEEARHPGGEWWGRDCGVNDAASMLRVGDAGCVTVFLPAPTAAGDGVTPARRPQRGLLDVRRMQQQERRASDEERRVHVLLRPLARFLPPSQHRALVLGMAAEVELRAAIGELSDARRQGARTLADADALRAERQRREAREGAGPAALAGVRGRGSEGAGAGAATVLGAGVGLGLGAPMGLAGLAAARRLGPRPGVDLSHKPTAMDGAPREVQRLLESSGLGQDSRVPALQTWRAESAPHVRALPGSELLEEGDARACGALRVLPSQVLAARAVLGDARKGDSAKAKVGVQQLCISLLVVGARSATARMTTRVPARLAGLAGGGGGPGQLTQRQACGGVGDHGVGPGGGVVAGHVSAVSAAVRLEEPLPPGHVICGLCFPSHAHGELLKAILCAKKSAPACHLRELFGCFCDFLPLLMAVSVLPMRRGGGCIRAALGSACVLARST